MNHSDQPFQRKLKIGSRGSPLALKQVEEILDGLAQSGVKISFEHKIYQTRGDKDKSTSLSTSPADDFFTDTLDQALLNHEIDVAVHSAKDLPQNLRENLSIFALTKSINETDSLVSKKKISDLPPGAKIGTSSPTRTSAIKALNPFVETVDIRGNIEERLGLVDSGRIDGVIVATCALERLNLAHRIMEVMPWETTPLQGQLVVVGRDENEDVAQLFSKMDVRKNYGRVILVGAGPGDPELITLKGVEALKKAECVFYDYLVDPELLMFAPRAEHIYVGKRKGEHTLSQSQLSRLLKEKAISGKNIVRLKGGDPLIFGRGPDEIEYLRAYHIDVEVIPGVSSATGLPSLLGIPLTARGVSSSVAFVSGHEENESADEPKAIPIPAAETLVFLMGLSKLNIIVQSLKEADWKNETPVMIISRGTRKDQKVISGTIDSISAVVQKEEIHPPALIIVGNVVKFWRPRCLPNSTPGVELANRILYLGTNPKKYQDLGEIIHVPMIDILPVSFSQTEKDELIKELRDSNIALFTSRFAVIHLMNLLEEQQSTSILKNIQCVAIGIDTAAVLKEFGITPKVTSDVETSEGLFETMKEKFNLKEKKIFFPRSSLPNSFLKEALTGAGAKVKEITIYENHNAAPTHIPLEKVDKVLFTSPSTVRYFISNFGTIPRHWQILSKGPHTSEALKKAGYESEILINE